MARPDGEEEQAAHEQDEPRSEYLGRRRPVIRKAKYDMIMPDADWKQSAGGGFVAMRGVERQIEPQADQVRVQHLADQPQHAEHAEPSAKERRHNVPKGAGRRGADAKEQGELPPCSLDAGEG